MSDNNDIFFRIIIYTLYYYYFFFSFSFILAFLIMLFLNKMFK